MKSTDNSIKTSAVTLVFFLSAAAWATHDLIQEDCASSQTQAQADKAGDEPVLRPLTD